MRILVDITHPAHVHFFRNALDEWRGRGHDVVVTARGKDIALELLKDYGIGHRDLGPARAGLPGLARELLVRNWRLGKVVREVRPDVLTAIGGIFIAQVGWLTGVPSVVFTDTENATLSNRLTFPFCTAVCTPRCYEAPVPRAKHRTYAGYHELAYTTPRRFTPDPSALAAFGLRPAEPFLVLRLVSWGAAHDVSDHGFTEVAGAVKRLSAYGRVVISSERRLPPVLEPLRAAAKPHLMHHLLAFARLFIGESATMASESATLGTPALFVSTSVRGYTNEQEQRYGLTYTFSDPREGQRQALEKAEEILSDPRAGALWEEKRQRMLADMTDVTDYVVDVVESHARLR
ncbi:MAG: DUF354 domain-containing protein [Deltaproteobacteria bacterium]|nr:DUF354 domain-containing protein [Deltaproteobacteria bacterium]